MRKLKTPENDNLKKLLKYSDRYQISIQFWPDYTTVFIMKNDVDLQSYGGEGCIDRSLEYLDRINRVKS